MNKWWYGAERIRTPVIIGNTVSIVHEHLRGTVLDVSDQVLLSLMAGEPLCCTEELRTPEITDPNVTIVPNKNIVRLDVMVDNAQ